MRPVNDVISTHYSLNTNQANIIQNYIKSIVTKIPIFSI